MINRPKIGEWFAIFDFYKAKTEYGRVINFSTNDITFRMNDGSVKKTKFNCCTKIYEKSLLEYLGKNEREQLTD